MEPTKDNLSRTESAGYVAAVSAGLLQRLFRGKHMSAAIIVMAGAILLLGGSLIRHDDTQLFLQAFGFILAVFGFMGWIFGSPESGR